MPQVKKIAIVWESETSSGVNSYLRYLLQSKAFLDKQITIFTNSENKGAKFLIKENYTSKGKMRIRLYKDTPLHRANFLMLAKSGFCLLSMYVAKCDN